MRSPGVSGDSTSLSEYSRVDSTPGECPAVRLGSGVGGLSWLITGSGAITCGRGEGSSGTMMVIGEDGRTAETMLGRAAGVITMWPLEETALATSSVGVSGSDKFPITCQENRYDMVRDNNTKSMVGLCWTGADCEALREDNP